MTKLRWAGIDFGSKMAGTTAITFLDTNQLKTLQVEKGQDTDRWLLRTIADQSIGQIFIDAPISLPGAYYGKGDNFSHRKSDSILRAMSPMFLGGLTARAIQLKTELSKTGVSCIEVYPGGFIRQNPTLMTDYDKKNPLTLIKMSDIFASYLPNGLIESPKNYHQLDSLICWYIGYTYLNGTAKSYGDPEEGLIWI
jgi:uncharacterized protein